MKGRACRLLEINCINEYLDSDVKGRCMSVSDMSDKSLAQLKESVRNILIYLLRDWNWRSYIKRLQFTALQWIDWRLDKLMYSSWVWYCKNYDSLYTCVNNSSLYKICYCLRRQISVSLVVLIYTVFKFVEFDKGLCVLSSSELYIEQPWVASEGVNWVKVLDQGILVWEESVSWLAVAVGAGGVIVASEIWVPPSFNKRLNLIAHLLVLGHRPTLQPLSWFYCPEPCKCTRQPRWRRVTGIPRWS